MNKYFYTKDEMESVFRSQNLQYTSQYSVDKLVSRMRELNQLDIEVQKKQSIAIVGNSGKLKNEKYGELIDSHDIVIRCNLARIKGYEKNVGTKTDFRFIAGKSFWRDLSNNFSAYDDNFLTSLKNQTFVIKAEPLYPAIQGIIKNYNTESNIIYIRQNYIDNSERKIGIYDISLGLTAILMSMEWSENISLFGFSFWQGQDWNERHYFENIKPYQIGHNPLPEKLYVDKLLEQNLLKMY